MSGRSRHPAMKARPGRAFFFLVPEDVAVRNLQEATERTCELKVGRVALDALLPAGFEALGASPFVAVD